MFLQPKKFIEPVTLSVPVTFRLFMTLRCPATVRFGIVTGPETVDEYPLLIVTSFSNTSSFVAKTPSD